MSDLHGEDAFDRVLDRMVEAEKRSAVLEDRARSGDQRVTLLQRDLNTARSDLTSAKRELAEFEKGEEAFAKLYTAIEIVTAKLRVEGLVELADGLYVTMTAAKKFIDPIPF